MFEKISLAGVSNAEWLRLRKTGIGGSDAGAVCGVNPYSSAMKVFQDKTGEAVEEQDSEAVRIGHDLEQYVAERPEIYADYATVSHCRRFEVKAA